MDIKELIKQKKQKKKNSIEGIRESSINNKWNESTNNKVKESIKSKENVSNSRKQIKIFANKNMKSVSPNTPTTKINNIPCDHSEYVYLRPDTISHIVIKDRKECIKGCTEHPCTFLCPSHVYGWTTNGLNVAYQRCIECGACNIFCPSGNIVWSYPRSGFGIQRKY